MSRYGDCDQDQIGKDSILKHLPIEQAFEKIESYQSESRISQAECLSEDEVERLLIAASPENPSHHLFPVQIRMSRERDDKHQAQ